MIRLLKSRGLLIADEQRAANYLGNIGYYRMSAYFHPLLEEPKANHRYKTGATFDMALDMYCFDRKFRILLFNEIEKIEVAIRSAATNYVSADLCDIFWMTNPKYFHSKDIFRKTQERIQAELERTKEDFIRHFQSKYSNPYPPAWMIAETISLGVLSNLCNNLKSRALSKQIAAHFALPLSVFQSWLLSLINLRNMCGHHHRVWNRDIPLVPANLKSPTFPWINLAATDVKRMYFRVCIIKYLLFTVSPNNRFTGKLESLLAGYPAIDIKAMGFPCGWQNEPLWRK